MLKIVNFMLYVFTTIKTMGGKMTKCQAFLLSTRSWGKECLCVLGRGDGVPSVKEQVGTLLPKS